MAKRWIVSIPCSWKRWNSWRIFAVALVFQFYLWCTRWVYLLTCQSSAVRGALSTNLGILACTTTAKGVFKTSLKNLTCKINFDSPFSRPYGYSAWGWGSEGYGYRPIVTAQPNTFYGGYFRYQYYPGFWTFSTFKYSKYFFTASKQLLKFLRLLVCSPKGAKDLSMALW